MSERVKVSSKTPELKRDNSASRIKRADSSQSLRSPIDHILSLQRTIGNQAVQRMFESGVIQAKLKIGQPNDKYEEEADRVAEQVMRMPEPLVQHQPEEEEEEEELIQTKPLAEQITPLVQRQVEEEEEELIQTKENPGQTPEVTPDLESHIQSLRGCGQPLPESIRAFFEPRFGHDFSQVRVHTDTEAHMLNCALNARAFTIGQDIFVHQRDYNSGSSHGRELLAHELTHVVQQNFPGNETRVQLKEDKTSEPAITDVSDDTVYKVLDPKAIIRTAPPALKSKGTKISWDSQVKITQRYAKDGKSYVYVKKAYGDKSDWGWSLEDNLDVSDVPSAERYGCVEASVYFTKWGKYLQQETIDALDKINYPIRIRNDRGTVIGTYWLRLTECMYPTKVPPHKDKGHYTGHCVDINFANRWGEKKRYGGRPGTADDKAKKELEAQGGGAFDRIKKEHNHLHGCVSYPSWVRSRKTKHLRNLLRERKNEYK